MSFRVNQLLTRLLAMAMIIATTALGQGRPVAGTVLALEGGRPVPDAEVVIFGAISRTASRPRLAATTTDASGSFRVEGVQPGPLLIRVRASGFARAAATVQRQAADALVIRLARGRGAVGRVIDRVTGAPVAGARIIAPQTEITSDDEGRFEIDGLPCVSDRLVVEVQKRGFVPQQIVIPDGTDPLELTAKLDIGRAVGVRVVDDEGRPVAGVRVRARLLGVVAYSGIERADLSATTNADGIAAVTGLPAGIPVCVEAGTLVGAHSRVVMPSRAPRAGLPPVTLDLTLTEGRAASIEVVDGHGVPVVGASLQVLPMVEPLLPFGGGADREFARGGLRGGTTDESGRALWRDLPANPLTCEVRAQGMTTRMVVLHPSTESDPRPVRVVLHRDADPPGATFSWSPSVAQALDRADRDGLPVLVCMSMDDERANDWLASHHYRDIELARVTREMPTLLSNPFGVGGVSSGVEHVEIDGVCSRYGDHACAVHRANERWCALQLFGPKVPFQVPQHILLGANGEVLLRVEFFLSERELLRLVLFGLRHVKPQRALALARERLLRLRQRLVSFDAEVRARALQDLVLLVNTGDEHAAALLGDLALLGVAPGERAGAVARQLVPDAIRRFDSALRPLIRDPDPTVRLVTAARVAGAKDGTALVDLLSDAITDPDPKVAMAARNAVGVGTRGDQLVVMNPSEGDRWRLVTRLLARQQALLIDGVRAVIHSTNVVARNRVLRRLAQRCDHDDLAYRLIMESAMKDDIAALPALRAIRSARPRSRRGQLDALVDVHFGSSSRLQREEAMHLASWVGSEAARELQAEGLDDWEPDVQVAAALGRLALRDPRCAPIILQWIDDPVRGPSIRAALREQYGAWVPREDWSWRRWFAAEGLIDSDEDGDR